MNGSDPDNGDPPADPRRSFDQSAPIYHRARPTYPDALFDLLFDLLPEAPRILEVGPGTGLATEPMLDRGASIRAVELGPNLASVLAERLAHSVADGHLVVEVGEFEQVDIEPGTVDAVVSATAYHWIASHEQLARPRRWLRPDGRLAVIDTIQVAADVDQGFFGAASPIFERFGQGRAGTVPLPDDAVPAIHTRMVADPYCRDLTLDRFRWDQTYSAADYGRLLLTFSGPLTMPIDERRRLVDELIELVEQRGGSVVRPLVMTLATCRFEPDVSY